MTTHNFGQSRFKKTKPKRFGAPQRRYRDRPVDTTKVFKDVQSNEDLAAIHLRTGVPLSTLYRWKSRIARDPTWSPLAKTGSSRQIFTPDEEKAISARITADFIEQGLLFTNEDFRSLILAYYVEKFRNSKKIPPFNCANGFIWRFKSRNGFTSRKAHFKRRPAASPEDIKCWEEQIRALLETTPRELIVNCDETSWKVYPENILTWAMKGTDATPLTFNGSSKDCITVLASVTAAGTRLPLFFLAEGKTERAEHGQMGDVGFHWTSHSSSGWQTSETFSTYLMHLREYFGDHKIHLILDVHASHRTDDVKKLAHNLDIQLWYIPPGCTDILQPLDRLCFGVLKSTARSLWRKALTDEPHKKFTKKDAVAFMIAAWEHLGSYIIEEAWEI